MNLILLAAFVTAATAVAAFPAGEIPKLRRTPYPSFLEASAPSFPSSLNTLSPTKAFPAPSKVNGHLAELHAAANLSEFSEIDSSVADTSDSNHGGETIALKLEQFLPLTPISSPPPPPPPSSSPLLPPQGILDHLVKSGPASPLKKSRFRSCQGSWVALIVVSGLLALAIVVICCGRPVVRSAWQFVDGRIDPILISWNLTNMAMNVA